MMMIVGVRLCVCERSDVDTRHDSYIIIYIISNFVYVKRCFIYSIFVL